MAGVTRVPPEMFRFSIGDRSDLYTSILQVFGAANERLETTLGLDDIADRLQALGRFGGMSSEDLFLILGQLREWQLIDVTQNHAGNYRTAEEYERRNLQYSLTRRGEAALAGVEHALAVLTSTGALQTAVLDAIGDRLTELGRILVDPATADRRIFTALQELEGHLEGLRNNTKQFNGELQRLLRAEGADFATFHEVKTATVSYLQEFLTNLDQRVLVIVAAIDRLEQHGIDELQRRALRGAELPTLGLEDPAPEWLAHRRARWEGLRAWFRPDNGEPARVEQLHVVARRAIVSLLQVLDRMTESRRRASSATADFRELARWFALAPTDDDLHRLWRAAFGLSSARHAHLAHRDPELIAPGVPWREATPVEVSALLRSSGRTERFTRTGRVKDVASLRAARAARARQERAEIDAAWSLLAGDEPVRLSQIGQLDQAVFERLLDLLGRALVSDQQADGVRRAATADGRLEVRLRGPLDDTVAVLHTPQGTFTAPDYVLEIVDGLATPARSAGVSSAAADQEAAG